jgi:hypothetical protein
MPPRPMRSTSRYLPATSRPCSDTNAALPTAARLTASPTRYPTGVSRVGSPASSAGGQQGGTGACLPVGQPDAVVDRCVRHVDSVVRDLLRRVSIARCTAPPRPTGRSGRRARGRAVPPRCPLRSSERVSPIGIGVADNHAIGPTSRPLALSNSMPKFRPCLSAQHPPGFWTGAPGVSSGPGPRAVEQSASAGARLPWPPSDTGSSDKGPGARLRRLGEGLMPGTVPTGREPHRQHRDRDHRAPVPDGGDGPTAVAAPGAIPHSRAPHRSAYTQVRDPGVLQSGHGGLLPTEPGDRSPGR